MDEIKKAAAKHESDLNASLARNFEIESQIEEAKQKATVAEKAATDALARARKAEKVCFTYSTISRFLDWILMEHIDMKCSLDSKLQIYSICSIIISFRNPDIFGNINPFQTSSSPVWTLSSPKTLPKTNFGPAFVAKHNPLDIVLTFNPTTTQPLGLVKLGQMLEKRFKVQTKIHVHSTATGQKCNLFKASPNTSSR